MFSAILPIVLMLLMVMGQMALLTKRGQVVKPVIGMVMIYMCDSEDNLCITKYLVHGLPAVAIPLLTFHHIPHLRSGQMVSIFGYDQPVRYGAPFTLA